ncbi:hypothetical protein, partial [Vibrio europaeus]|uniref:hypothetical protein n=1 Tax=Vibrio europaeus TaxID=300876 RepID=UPI001C1037DC
VLQFSSSPVLQFSSSPVLQFSSSPVLQFSSSPVLQKQKGQPQEVRLAAISVNKMGSLTTSVG